MTTERLIKVGEFDVLLRTSTRRTKDIGITVDGQVVVRAPHGTTPMDAAALVRRRREWIYRQLHRLKRARTTPVTKTLTEGEEFLVLGTPHQLDLAHITDDTPPVTTHHHPTNGPLLQLDHRLAGRPTHARNALIHWYAQQAQNWLNENGEHITLNQDKARTRLRASVRLSTALVAHRPHHELVLSWAAAQLDHANLRTLIADTLGRAPAAALRDLRNAYRNLWLGELHANPTHSASREP